MYIHAVCSSMLSFLFCDCKGIENTESKKAFTFIFCERG